MAKTRVEFYVTCMPHDYHALPEPPIDQRTKDGVYEVAGHKYRVEVGIRRIKWIDVRFAIRLLSLGRIATDLSNIKTEGKRYALKTVQEEGRRFNGQAWSGIERVASPEM